MALPPLPPSLRLVDDGVAHPLGIITPEAVVLDLRPAGIATRVFAKAIDLALQATALLLGWWGFSFALGGTAMIVVGLIWTFVVVLVLPGAVEVAGAGRTPGKLALGIRVVSVDGGPQTTLAAATRSVFQIVDVYAALGVLPMLLTRRSQRFGDLVAGTFVLDERVESAATIPIAFLPPPGTDAWVNAADVARVTSGQYQVMRSFLLRVGELDPVAREALAVEIAERARARVSPDPWPWFTAELYVNCVASAYQLRHGGLPVVSPWPSS